MRVGPARSDKRRARNPLGHWGWRGGCRFSPLCEGTRRNAPGRRRSRWAARSGGGRGGRSLFRERGAFRRDGLSRVPARCERSHDEGRCVRGRFSTRECSAVHGGCSTSDGAWSGRCSSASRTCARRNPVSGMERNVRCFRGRAESRPRAINRRRGRALSRDGAPRFRAACRRQPNVCTRRYARALALIARSARIHRFRLRRGRRVFAQRRSNRISGCAWGESAQLFRLWNVARRRNDRCLCALRYAAPRRLLGVQRRLRTLRLRGRSGCAGEFGSSEVTGEKNAPRSWAEPRGAWVFPRHCGMGS